MKYFEFTAPSYSLVGAADQENALKLYDKEMDLKEEQVVHFSEVEESTARRVYQNMMGKLNDEEKNKDADEQFSKMAQEKNIVFIAEH